MLILRLDQHVVLDAAPATDFLNSLALHFAVLLRVLDHLPDVLNAMLSLFFDQLHSLLLQFGLQLLNFDLEATLDDHHHSIEVISIQLTVCDFQLAIEGLEAQRVDLLVHPLGDDFVGFLWRHLWVDEKGIFEIFLFNSLLLGHLADRVDVLFAILTSCGLLIVATHTFVNCDTGCGYSDANGNES